MLLFLFLFFSSVVSLRESQLLAIQSDIDQLFDEFEAPEGFFFPATALRLAFHDAGTFSKSAGNGGSHAAMIFDCAAGQKLCERNNPDNVGLPWAVDALETVYKLYSNVCSRTDFWQIAANVAIVKTGGPEINFRWGRKDAVSALQSVTGRLPPSNLDWNGVTSFLGRSRLGLSDREIVALLGAHTIGSTHLDASGHRFAWDTTPDTFDNQYYINLMRDGWDFVPPSRFGPFQQQWEADRRIGRSNQFVSTLMLDADFSMKQNPRNPNFLSPVIDITNFYAINERAWIEDFIIAWEKVQELGHSNLRSICRDNDNDPSCDFVKQDSLQQTSAPQSNRNSFRDDGAPEPAPAPLAPWAWALIALAIIVVLGFVVGGIVLFRHYRNGTPETV